MSTLLPASVELFSVREIARAAGVSAAAARDFIAATGPHPRDGYLSVSEAVRCVKLLRRRVRPNRERGLFVPPPAGLGSSRAGIAASGAVHAALLGLIVFVTTLGFTARAEKPDQPADVTRLVFLATPGPGGGGGGGGLKQPKPPAKAEMKSAASLRSPVPPPRTLTARRPQSQTPQRPRVIVPSPVEPPPPPSRPEVTPQVVAPVVSASSDARDRAGVLTERAPEPESQGSGSGGGAGTGQGSGMGEGSGAGIGPGSGGGTGGGPYRPGSGITAPALLREVRPVYTEDARRLGIEGDVVLEIVVRSDGSVGDVKILQGLGGGLDRRAIDAVRQWRFSPARRYGTPVDVIVEIAVEFKLR